MQKILHIITLSELGGAQKIVYSLIQGMCEEYEVILACSPGGELVQWVRDLGVKVYELPHMRRGISPYHDLINLKELIKIIHQEKVDIVHCHSWKGGVTGRIAGFLTSTRQIVFTVHGWSMLHSNSILVRDTYWLIEKFLGYLSHKIVCVCEMDQILGIQRRIASKEKFYTIYNGIDPVTNHKTGQVGDNLKIPKGAIVIGTVARLAEQKMVPETIEILKPLFIKHKNLYFIWVGDGALYNNAQRKVKEYGIADRFLFAGNRQDIYPYLNVMDIYLLLSKYEGLSVSILEAMSAGLPVVASNVGGVKEQVEDGISGFLVSDDLNRVESCLELLIKDKDKRKAFGKAGNDLYKSKFTRQEMVDNYKKLYAKE